MSLAMSAATSGRPINRLGCVAGFLRARMAFLTFIRVVFALSAARLYSAKSLRRFLRHFISGLHVLMATKPLLFVFRVRFGRDENISLRVQLFRTSVESMVDRSTCGSISSRLKL